MRAVLWAIRQAAIERLNWLWHVCAAPGDARIGWGARLLGRRIEFGRGCAVESGALIDAALRRPAEEYVKLGDGCRLRTGAQVHSWDGFVELGVDCTINAGAVLYGTGGLRVGRHVRIGAGTVIVASAHRFDRTDAPIARQGVSRKGIVIEDDVWIGAGVRILDGVRIGTGSVIGANAVVNRDVEPNSVMAGVPARLIRKRGATRAALADGPRA